MATDPTISLHATDGLQQGGGFGQLGGMIDTLNKINQNKLFQQTFQAKQRAGAIIASSPDLETGMANLYKDPLVAPFAGEIVSNIRQGMLAQTQQQGAVQEQVEKGLQGYLKGVAASGGDEKALAANSKLFLGAMSPAAQAIAGPLIDNFHTSLTAGLPRNADGTLTPEGQAKFKQNLLAKAVTVDMAPSVASLAYGQPGIQNRGGTLSPTMTNLATGAVTAAGPSVGMTLPPGFVGGGQLPVGGAGAAEFPAAGANPLGVLPQTGGTGAGGGDGAASLGVTPARQAAINHANSSIPGAGGDGNLPPPDIGTPPVAGDGKPLWSSPDDFKSGVTYPKGTGGIPVMTDAQKEIATGMAHDFANEGAERARNAQTSQAALTNIEADIDNLGKAGGFLTPGAFGQSREFLAKAGNTFAQILGKGNIPFDADSIASMESWQKERGRLGPQVLTQLTGQNHQAASTIADLTQTVPGINNTYMGAKLLVNGLQAMTQRTIDERQFMQQWANANQGNLTGADTAFNKLHPASDYAKGVLDKYGLTDKGFKSADAVKQAYAQGYITQKQASTVLHDQFGFDDDVKGEH